MNNKDDLKVESEKKINISPNYAFPGKSTANAQNNQIINPKKITYEVMVTNALIALNERNGSSVLAIKKYIVSNYTFENTNNISLFIKRYIKKALSEGFLQQKKHSFSLTKKKHNAIKQKEKDEKKKKQEAKKYKEQILKEKKKLKKVN